MSYIGYSYKVWCTRVAIGVYTRSSIKFILPFILILLPVCVDAQTDLDSLAIFKKDTVVHNESMMTGGKSGNMAGGKSLTVDSGLSFTTDTVLKRDSTAASVSVVKKKPHSVKRAVWLSAALPGLGQAYNHKYWKIPIIYAGFGGLGYALYYTSTQYNLARNAYRRVVNGQDASYNGYYYPANSDASTIKAYRDYYQGYLNISAILTVVWYGLNLVDAAVDGHLYSYNMDDKLSLNFDPTFHIQNEIGLSQSCLGLSFTVVPLAGKQGRRHM
jgi:hypothetical protein